MADARVAPSLRRWLSGLLTGAVLVAVASGLVALLGSQAPDLVGLPAVYLLAVLPVAMRWGTGPGLAVAVASAATFAFLFVPPRLVFAISGPRYALSLGVFLLTAVVVAYIAARSARHGYESARLSREQAGLRRVATLVAHAAKPREVFTAVSDEVARLLEPDLTTLVRFESDGSATFLAGGGWLGRGVQGGRTMPVPASLAPLRDGAVVRLDDLRQHPDMSEAVERQGLLGVVGCPIVVEGRVWGAFGVGSRSGAFPTDTEQRLVDFTELIGTAIANAESRSVITRLLDEQAALRRVATLVARGVRPEAVFTTVTDEIGRVLGADIAVMLRLDPGGGTTVVGRAGYADEMPVGSRWELDSDFATEEVLRTGKPARRDDHRDVAGAFAAIVRRIRVRSSVAIPIVVEGRTWGALGVGATRERFPADTERRMSGFTDLVSTAIANADSRSETVRLLDEQSVLRRVATVVAQGASAPEVFAVAADEAVKLLGVDAALLYRLDETRRSATWVAISGWQNGPVGRRFPTNRNVAKALGRGDPFRVDDIAAMSETDDALRGSGLRAAVVCAITVEGQVWGGFTVCSRSGPLPSGTEHRLVDFAELIGTAIANAESRAEITRLLEHQAALRRVATLVAREAPPDDVMPAVADEIGRVFGADAMHMLRLEPDGGAMIVAQKGDHPPEMGVGNRYELDPGLAMTEALQTGRPARRDRYDQLGRRYGEIVRGMRLRSGVAIPILVEGRIWGTLGIATSSGTFPPDTEQRLASFTELIALAIGNTENRAQILRLLAEQGALRRVATIVATGPSATEVSRAVAEEIRGLLGVGDAGVCRYEPDGTAVLLVGVGDNLGRLPPGTRWELDDITSRSEVWRTGRPARFDSDRWEHAEGPAADQLREMGVRSVAASPVTVDGRLWGAVLVWSSGAALPEDTEQRMARFTELVAMAIGNAESRAQLAASRARVVAASDETRRRIERDLHDGAQQRLVSLGLELRLAQAGVPDELPEVREGIGRVADDLSGVLDELREMARGIHPAMLSEGGLRPALRTLARRSSVPVELDLATDDRFPHPIEVATYYVVSEALTNTAKHADASYVSVSLAKLDGGLHLSVRDDGVGGADPQAGTGLVGLRDRVEALGGTIEIKSPQGTGTTVLVTLPTEDGRVTGARER